MAPFSGLRRNPTEPAPALSNGHRNMSGVIIALAPLSDRPEDVVALAPHFAGQQGQVLDEGCERALLNYTWPGKCS